MASANKTNRIIYWVATGLVCAMMLGSASMYFIKYEEIVGVFKSLGHPAHVIYPLAIAKFLGVLAILSDKSKLLKEWAYAGIFFDFLLAFGAHIAAGDNEWAGAVVAAVLLLVSRYFYSAR